MNIYDIAKEAGVSISTVSRVMNHKGNVNPETRKKVEEILEKNNYTPSADLYRWKGKIQSAAGRDAKSKKIYSFSVLYYP